MDGWSRNLKARSLILFAQSRMVGLFIFDIDFILENHWFSCLKIEKSTGKPRLMKKAGESNLLLYFAFFSRQKDGLAHHNRMVLVYCHPVAHLLLLDR